MSKAAVFAAKQEQIQGFKWGEGGSSGGKKRGGGGVQRLSQGIL